MLEHALRAVDVQAGAASARKLSESRLLLITRHDSAGPRLRVGSIAHQRQPSPYGTHVHSRGHCAPSRSVQRALTPPSLSGPARERPCASEVPAIATRAAWWEFQRHPPWASLTNHPARFTHARMFMSVLVWRSNASCGNGLVSTSDGFSLVSILRTATTPSAVSSRTLK